MSSKRSQKQEAERRGYFRIKDELILFFSEINENDERPAELKNGVISGFSLASALNQINADIQTQLKLLEKENSRMVSCLKTLNRKIDVLAQAILISDLALPAQSAREVDLSASGLAFRSDKTIEAGTLVELKMILPSSLVAIVAHGRVVYCEQDMESGKSADGFQVGVEFTNLADHDREILIRHVLKKQMKGIRNRSKS